MLNNKYLIKKENGYVLITTLFILVSFLSAILLASYPLFKEVRGDSDAYIIDRNDYRFRKAYFGDFVDQCATKLSHCGGLHSDYPDSGQSGTDRYIRQTRIIARYLGTLGQPRLIEIPVKFEYTADTFWRGYWGKRYLHILPSDDWDYNTIYPETLQNKNEVNKVNIDHRFYNPYRPYSSQWSADISMSSACGGGSWGYSYANFAKMELGYSPGMTYKGYEIPCVEIKDYSSQKDSHSLRVVTVGSTNRKQNMYFECNDIKDCSDYILYKYELVDIKGSLAVNPASNTGQKKLLIQVRENGSDSWVTRDTKLIIFSLRTSRHNSMIFGINFYG